MKSSSFRSVFGVLVCLTSVSGADVTVPLGGGAAGVGKLALAPLPGVSAEVGRIPNGDGAAETLKVTFSKNGEERRLVALQAVLAGDLQVMKALDMRCRLALDDGLAARPAALLFDSRGGAWYKLARPLGATNGFIDMRFSLQALREAAFSQATGEELNWRAVRRAWLGLVLDGTGKGEFELSRAVLTDRPYRPKSPVSVMKTDPAAWSVGKDKAVTAELTAPKEGPDGSPCVTFAFTFPGGRHMYATPTQSVPELELSAYKGVRLTYKANLPNGIGGLLVLLTEAGGGAYVPQTAPPASAEWTQFTIPFDDFKLAGWTRDANGRLDLDSVSKITVGAHGGATGKGGDGCIRLADIEFVPELGD